MAIAFVYSIYQDAPLLFVEDNGRILKEKESTLQANVEINEGNFVWLNEQNNIIKPPVNGREFNNKVFEYARSFLRESELRPGERIIIRNADILLLYSGLTDIICNFSNETAPDWIQENAEDGNLPSYFWKNTSILLGLYYFYDNNPEFRNYPPFKHFSEEIRNLLNNNTNIVTNIVNGGNHKVLQLLLENITDDQIKKSLEGDNLDNNLKLYIINSILTVDEQSFIQLRKTFDGNLFKQFLNYRPNELKNWNSGWQLFQEGLLPQETFKKLAADQDETTLFNIRSQIAPELFQDIINEKGRWSVWTSGLQLFQDGLLPKKTFISLAADQDETTLLNLRGQLNDDELFKQIIKQKGEWNDWQTGLSLFVDNVLSEELFIELASRTFDDYLFRAKDTIRDLFPNILQRRNPSWNDWESGKQLFLDNLIPREIFIDLAKRQDEATLLNLREQLNNDVLFGQILLTRNSWGDWVSGLKLYNEGLLPVNPFISLAGRQTDQDLFAVRSQIDPELFRQIISERGWYDWESGKKLFLVDNLMPRNIFIRLANNHWLVKDLFTLWKKINKDDNLFKDILRNRDWNNTIINDDIDWKTVLNLFELQFLEKNIFINIAATQPCQTLFEDHNRIKNVFNEILKKRENWEDWPTGLKLCREYSDSFKTIDGPIKVWSDLASIRIKTLKQKDDRYKRIQDFIDKNNIKCLYHYTFYNNLDSIKKNFGLYSWKFLHDYNIISDENTLRNRYPEIYNEIQSSRNDDGDLYGKYVRLSFCKKHPLGFRRARQLKGHDSDYRLIVLKISPDVLFFEDAKYSNMNALGNEAMFSNDILTANINIAATREYHSRPNENDPGYQQKMELFQEQQAEVLIETCIPIKFILNINSPLENIY